MYDEMIMKVINMIFDKLPSYAAASSQHMK